MRQLAKKKEKMRKTLLSPLLQSHRRQTDNGQSRQSQQYLHI
jgi:hypothetical protein